MELTNLQKKYYDNEKIKDVVGDVFGLKKIANDNKTHTIACEVYADLSTKKILLPKTAAKMTAAQLTKLNKKMLNLV